MNYFKKMLDVICFVLGPLILIISIFSFDHKGLIGMGGPNPIYYSVESLAGIGIGAALICIGFLRIYWRKGEIEKK